MCLFCQPQVATGSMDTSVQVAGGLSPVVLASGSPSTKCHLASVAETAAQPWRAVCWGLWFALSTQGGNSLPTGTCRPVLKPLLRLANKMLSKT